MIRRRIKQLANRMRILGACRFAGQLRQPVFILTTGRSGSNLFVDLCNSLDSVRFLGEILHPTSTVGLPGQVLSRRRLIAHIQRSLQSVPAACAGAKIHFEHLESRQTDVGLLRESFPNALVVLLYRNRIADQFVSWKLARESGHWIGRSAADVARGRVRVDPDEFESYRERQISRYRMALSDEWIGDRVLTLEYETLAARPQEVFRDGVCPFLGAEYRPVGTDMVKQNTRPLRNVVENYDELADVLESALLGNGLSDLIAEPARSGVPQ